MCGGGGGGGRSYDLILLKWIIILLSDICTNILKNCKFSPNTIKHNKKKTWLKVKFPLGVPFKILVHNTQDQMSYAKNRSWLCAYSPLCVANFHGHSYSSFKVRRDLKITINGRFILLTRGYGFTTGCAPLVTLWKSILLLLRSTGSKISLSSNKKIFETMLYAVRRMEAK